LQVIVLDRADALTRYLQNDIHAFCLASMNVPLLHASILPPNGDWSLITEFLSRNRSR
jgi:hypothetical protein